MEPLVCKRIITHFESFRPFVPRSAHLHPLIPRTPIWEREWTRSLVENSFVKVRHNTLNFGLFVRLLTLSCAMVNFLEDLFLLVRAKDLLNDANGLIFIWGPRFKFLLELVDDCVIYENLFLESIEFT